jgi:hypothetical protein
MMGDIVCVLSESGPVVDDAVAEKHLQRSDNRLRIGVAHDFADGRIASILSLT